MTDFDLLGNDDGVTEAQNAEWFAADITPTGIGLFRFEVSVSLAVVIEVTLDSGANWTALNGNVALVADSLYTFDIFVQADDAFNIRIPTAGGAVVDIGRVYQPD